MNSESTEISIVIPVYNEENNVCSLHRSLKEILDKYNNYEIIFVDDGSTDSTLSKLKQICRIEENVYFISLSRNFGHQNALRAGIENTSGKAVISMDGDHQHPRQLLMI